VTTTPPPATVEYYASHEKIYPREVHGRFASLRNGAVFALLGIYYLLPWVRWDGRQAVLLDLPARRFYIFGLTLWPQDFIYLTWLLVIAALSLFFFTALGGRLWCGYACPQTVWTEAFLWMERITEGTRAQRIKLDKAPWSGAKLLRKLAKQFLWIVFALWTGYTFVSYFTPATTLASAVFAGSLGPWETFWILFYGFATYGNAGYLREQVCKYMCPYARFQSAMFDKDTMIITYDAARGEPRGSRPRGSAARSLGRGDCIDCTLCVQVCPTGIDIRKGLQYECIACAACIDACDSVMDKMGDPHGLIRYTTQHALDGRASRMLRPRVLIYGALLTLLVGGFVYSIGTRTLVDLDVLHDRSPLYRMLDSGQAENVYTLKILNKDDRAHTFRVSVSGAEQLELDPREPRYTVAAGELLPAVVRVRRDAYSTTNPHTIRFAIAAEDNERLGKAADSRFFGPTQ
jgi:cytochrome c oxidase accessory protein FixG